MISPLLANLYLDALDHDLARAGFEMVRYADDFVLLCASQEQAGLAMESVRKWTVHAGLQLHPEKTRIVNAKETGFDFLGYRFERGSKTPREKSLKKFKDAIRRHTGRSQGHSLQQTIVKLNRTLRGWFAYYKHSRKYTFSKLDGWIRMRLRSILRRHAKQKGRGSGWDHQRWPNAYFARAGLFSMAAAHALARRSSKR